MQHPSDNITKENMRDVIYWHKPNDSQVTRMEQIAKSCFDLLDAIMRLCPDCRDRNTAIDKLRETRMWANSSIALEKPATIDHTRGSSSTG